VEHQERLEGYAVQVAASARQLVAVVSEDNRLLRPAQRRRLRHKKHVAHGHRDLEWWQDDKGRLHRVPCPRCRPQPAAATFTGGGPW
jgi:hypothetical protein